MKRFILSIVALVGAFVSTNARDLVANVTLKLMCDGYTESSSVKVRKDLDNSLSSTSHAGNTLEPEAVNLYVYIDEEHTYATYASDRITDIPLRMLTNRRAAQYQHYTIYFSVLVDTETLILKDVVTGDEISIVDGGSYSFDINTTLHSDYVAGTNYEVINRFYVTSAYVPTEYKLCYTAGNFIIDNPDAAGTAYILDSIGNELSTYPVSAARQTSFTPAGLTTGNLYQVVGLHADTLFFRAR